MQEQLARLSVPVCIHQHRSLNGVPIPDVVRRVLEVPLELASLGVQREVGVGIQIVAEALIAVEVRPGVSGRPVDGAGLGIVSPRHPGATAGMSDVLALPGFRAWFAGLGDGPESPYLFA